MTDRSFRVVAAFVLTALLAGCASEPSVRLEFTGRAVPVGLWFDQESDHIFVAVTDLGAIPNPTGAIVVFDADGDLVDRDWSAAQTLRSPTGLARIGSELWICDGARVRRLPIANSGARPESSGVIEVERAISLDQITPDGAGGAFISDRETGLVHHLRSDGAQVSVLRRPEGVSALCQYGGRLFASSRTEAVLAEVSSDSWDPRTTFRFGLPGFTSLQRFDGRWYACGAGSDVIATFGVVDDQVVAASRAVGRTLPAPSLRLIGDDCAPASRLAVDPGRARLIVLQQSDPGLIALCFLDL
ncbi:MAG: hypothetical protein AAF196_06955 [Planctomycetota bacterium]